MVPFKAWLRQTTIRLGVFVVVILGIDYAIRGDIESLYAMGGVWALTQVTAFLLKWAFG